jgi:hypothetical protein
MKKYILIILAALLTTTVFTKVMAAGTPTPTDSSLLEQVANEIASKTAQLNLVEKRGIIGTVTDSSSTQITLSDLNGNIRFVDVDELTKFSSPTSDSYGISDVTNGTLLGVLGLYNKQSQRILARDVSVQTAFPSVIYGTISDIDKTNFELTIAKENGQKIVIEIQDVTKTYAFSAGTMAKSGFSKTQTGQTIVAIGFSDKQDSKKILGTRIILLPDIQTGFALNLGTAVNPTIPPSTGSGIKLYPITK